MQVRLLLHGSDTLLGVAAAEAELFVTNCFLELPLQGLASGLSAASVFRLQRQFGAELRLQQQLEDEQLGAENAAAREEGGVQTLWLVMLCIVWTAASLQQLPFVLS
jgi:hypothetical protein